MADFQIVCHLPVGFVIDFLIFLFFTFNDNPDL